MTSTPPCASRFSAVLPSSTRAHTRNTRTTRCQSSATRSSSADANASRTVHRPRRMPHYRITDEARADLDAIWLYVAERGGIESADRLIDAIIERFPRLAATPGMGVGKIWYIKPSELFSSRGMSEILHRISSIQVFH